MSYHFSAPCLPPGWIEMQTPDGQTFYYHQPSNTSHWSVPRAPTSQGHLQCPSSAAADFSRPSQRPASACVHGARGGGGSGPRLSDLSPDEVALVVRVYHTFLHATLQHYPFSDVRLESHEICPSCKTIPDQGNRPCKCQSRRTKCYI